MPKKAQFTGALTSATLALAMATLKVAPVLAEISPPLVGTVFEWKCQGTWKAMKRTIVKSDPGFLRYETERGGKTSWSERPNYLIGTAVIFQRDFNDGVGVRRWTFDDIALKGFGELRPGWKYSGKATESTSSWSTEMDLDIEIGEPREVNNPVYGKVMAIPVTEQHQYRNRRRTLVASKELIHPGDGVPLEFETIVERGNQDLDVKCRLVSRR